MKKSFDWKINSKLNSKSQKIELNVYLINCVDIFDDIERDEVEMSIAQMNVVQNVNTISLEINYDSISQFEST